MQKRASHRGSAAEVGKSLLFLLGLAGYLIWCAGLTLSGPSLIGSSPTVDGRRTSVEGHFDLFRSGHRVERYHVQRMEVGIPVPPPDKEMTSKLFKQISSQSSLTKAWAHIKATGNQSVSFKTRKAINQFDQHANKYIIQIQRGLRDGTYSFKPQTGITKNKDQSGNKKRGLVIAPIENRIVERSILDCLQDNVPYVKEILQTETSIGGVPNRGVGHGISIVYEKLQDPNAYYIRSDISGFFDSIPRNTVISSISNHINDDLVTDLIDRATKVTLENEKQLGHLRHLFPTDDTGVSQGSPLSPLFGNILLNEFDREFNQRGISCIRYIDDFVIIGKRRYAKKAFQEASTMLNSMGLRCHNPFNPKTPPHKAQHGEASKEFTFLGYSLNNKIIRPGDMAVSNLLSKIDKILDLGRKSIVRCVIQQDSLLSNVRYAQTLNLLDKTIRGWGEAFAYSNVQPKHIDDKINKKLKLLNDWFFNRTKELDKYSKRRALGVCLLTDIKAKSTDELPFFFEKLPNVRKNNMSVIVSTDGSLIPYHVLYEKNRGYGGWAAVFHNGNPSISGSAENVTNNQMELIAVISGLKMMKNNGQVIVRTDSKYIYDAASEGRMIRQNVTLWRELQSLCANLKVKFEWIKGHSGDNYNDLADKLANDAARQLKHRERT